MNYRNGLKYRNAFPVDRSARFKVSPGGREPRTKSAPASNSLKAGMTLPAPASARC